MVKVEIINIQTSLSVCHNEGHQQGCAPQNLCENRGTWWQRENAHLSWDSHVAGPMVT